MALKYIVTGTGRCGTNYLAKLLSSAGISCGRESVFNTTLKATGKLQADSSWMALPYLENHPDKWSKSTIIHLVRNPWDIMRGWLFDFESVFSVWRTRNVLRPTNTFLIRHTPVIHNIESPVRRSISYYIDWNYRIQALKNIGYNVIRVRAEDDEHDILRFIGIVSPSNAKLYTNRRDNTRKKSILSRQEVDCLLKSQTPIYYEYTELAKEYGYESP